MMNLQVKLLLGIVLVAATLVVGVVLFKTLTEQKATPPAIETVISTEGVTGSYIVIEGSGFTESNDIAFVSPAAVGQFKVGYINRISSPDGRTLRFTIPELLSACASSRLEKNEACPAIGIIPPQGETEIWVVNKNGESNKKKFKIVPAGGQ